ncbi:NUDIX domain-containing protein [Candidatus Woesearchaeota archaeon]|nr:NUDIX domain-containing protein [Candidatus Woesearchaeota archaeon]
MREDIVVVDEKDNFLGTEDKEKCHDGKGILHRGFIAMVYDSDSNLILARRSKKKRLWPGYWDGTVASHVREGETYEQAAKRRIKEELGISCDPKYRFKFRYAAKYDNKGIENEICAVLECSHNGKINPDSEEISELKKAKKEEIQPDKKKYVPWLLTALSKDKYLNNNLNRSEKC